MDIAFKNKIELNLDILPLKTKKAFVFLSEQEWLDGSGWYLAGGTALGLQSRHRRSVDLDFFTAKSELNSESVLANFINNKNWRTSFGEVNTVYGELFGAKVSFIAYPFFVPKQNFIQYGSIRILHRTDIAVMKIIAISQRGKKRDFFDLYWCAKNIEPLENLIKRLKAQYPLVAHDYHHILKSLVYFEDAENDPNTETSFKINWKDVKDYFKKEVPHITSRIIIKS